ncbi:BTB domain-containing protein [Balamuthia mandrillaris]
MYGLMRYESWDCPACTYLNEDAQESCSMCGAAKPDTPHNMRNIKLAKKDPSFTGLATPTFSYESPFFPSAKKRAAPPPVPSSTGTAFTFIAPSSSSSSSSTSSSGSPFVFGATSPFASPSSQNKEKEKERETSAEEATKEENQNSVEEAIADEAKSSVSEELAKLREKLKALDEESAKATLDRQKKQQELDVLTQKELNMQQQKAKVTALIKTAARAARVEKMKCDIDAEITTLRESFHEVRLQKQIQMKELEDLKTQLRAKQKDWEKLEGLSKQEQQISEERLKLSDERKALAQRSLAIGQQEDTLAQQQAEFQQQQRKRAEVDEKAKTAMKFSSERIKLNVGGTLFVTSRATLTHMPSMLQSMFSGRFSLEADKEDGSFFIDRDPTHFRFILNYLRDSHVELPSLSSAAAMDVLRQLLVEAEYYGLDGLVMQLRQMEEEGEERERSKRSKGKLQQQQKSKGEEEEELAKPNNLGGSATISSSIFSSAISSSSPQLLVGGPPPSSSIFLAPRKKRDEKQRGKKCNT